jgi:hypothetical protein
LLKGARILNAQRIEALVLVMMEVYQEMLSCPDFSVQPDISKALPRAHRSLCRMLDQAALWHAPGNARRMINRLYVCLERWRGDRGLAIRPAFNTIRECPAGHNDHAWRRCMATNHRLRKLLRQQDDLNSIRALLLELLRSQDDCIRRQSDYTQADGAQAEMATLPDALRVGKRL